jgi:MtfA peptidase
MGSKMALMGATILVLLAVGVLLALYAGPARRAWRRRRIARQPFPAEWRRLLRHRVPAFRRMPPDLQSQLRKRIQVFVAEKPFIGCAGMRITDEVRVTVAALACMLILNRPADVFPALREILVYPGAFAASRSVADEAGLQREVRQSMAGESWARGQVILSWQDVLEGAAIADDGRNVVLHEFAHQLDHEKGYASGVPFLGGHRHAYARWSQVFQREFDHLRAGLAQGQDTLLGAYAATEPAEFFAVATEVFFEQAAAMADRHPALFAALRSYYRVDPRDWQSTGASMRIG